MRQRKAKEEAETEKKEAESKVDEENNSVPVTPIRKVLSRTSSFEVIRSKTIILEETNERLERTTMNITQTKEPPQAVELKIKVKSPVSRPAILVQTKTESNGGSPKETSSADQSSGEDSPELDKELNKELDKEATRSPQFWPEKTPLPTPRLTREGRVLPAMVLPMPKRNKEEANQNGGRDSASEDEWHTPAGKATSHQKPPLPPTVSPRATSTTTNSSPPPPTLQPDSANDSLKPVKTLSRSNSIGTQTPKIKARTQVFFDEAASSSEESLSDAIAKEELQREVEKLRKELEGKNVTEGKLEGRKEQRAEVDTDVDGPTLPW